MPGKHNLDPKVKLVVNPAAGNGAAARKWPKIHKQLNASLDKFSIEFTKGAQDATRITKEALLDGYQTVVAAGGDGTTNEVVNGFFENDQLINPQASLGFISLGTGEDWPRTLGSRDIMEAVRTLREDRTQACDVGLVRCRDIKGNPVTRYFINVADAGFGAAVAARVNRSTKLFGSLISYLSGLLRTLAKYKNHPVIIKIDDFYEKEIALFSVAVANGQFFGGGMWIAPQAKFDDGLFEVVVIEELSRIEVLANIKKIYDGTLSKHPKVHCFQAKTVRLESDSEVLIETDGEHPGILPVTFEILPGALKIKC